MSASSRRPVITLLTDYGTTDEFVGVLHGVIAMICPDARVIDLTHGIGRHDIRSGATILAQSLPYLPVGVHLAVVDPTVGGDRRAVALRLAGGRMLVGPDNGLLWPASQAGGGVEQAVEISQSRWRSEPVSATFHGRDHLRAGHCSSRCRGAVRPGRCAARPLAAGPRGGTAGPNRGRRASRDSVNNTDRFGNVQLGAAPEDTRGLGVEFGDGLACGSVGRVLRATYGRTFSDVSRGRVARVRGLRPHARARGQPWQRRAAGTGPALRRSRCAQPDDGVSSEKPRQSKRVHLRRTESTNTVARDLAARGAPHGTLVTAASNPPVAAVRAAAGARRRARRCCAPG